MLCGETFPGFTVVENETGVVDELESDDNDLFDTVGSVTGGVVTTTIFDPVEKGFNWLVYVIRGAEDSVIFLQICGGDVGGRGVQLVQDGTGGGDSVSDVLVSEGADEHFINSREKHLSERLVSAIVLIEESRGGVKVGYGVNGFLLIELRCILFLQDIGGVEFSTVSGDFRFVSFVVSC